MNAWLEEYQRKLVSSHDAVKVVRSGDRVVIASNPEPVALPTALAARHRQLQKVEIVTDGWNADIAWFQPGLEESFVIYKPGRTVGQKFERSYDYFMDFLPLRFKPWDEGRPSARAIDVFVVCVSPPDKSGYCSFGRALQSKRSLVARARVVLAEVVDTPTMNVRTFGDNYIHVSEITHFAEGTGIDSAAALIYRDRTLPSWMKDLTHHVASLIRDGDTIQMGTGSSVEPLVSLGLLDGRKDLGLHTGATFRGVNRLVREGVINGRKKTINPEKVIFTVFYEDDPEDLEFVSMNPAFEQWSMERIHDIRTIAAHDNFVAINNALSVDLTGQINLESIGKTHIGGGGGGQPPFHIGALLSKGGRAIVVLPSLAYVGGNPNAGGKKSRIVAKFPEGSIITIPRNLADYVVTEYGVASLMGKSLYQRVEELINIAHPDFRANLRHEAQAWF